MKNSLSHNSQRSAAAESVGILSETNRCGKYCL